VADIRVQVTKEEVTIWRTGQTSKGMSRVIPGSQEILKRGDPIDESLKAFLNTEWIGQKQGGSNGDRTG